VGDERRPGGGRADPAPVAFDERDAHLGLEGGDRLGDRRLRVRESIGGGRERTTVHDFAEDHQTLHV
jgi:hypothetical protein